MRDRTRQCLEDMRSSAGTAIRYVAEDDEGWAHDGLRLDAILRRVGLVGEAASRVPVADRDEFPAIAWREIIGMRQHVVHGYDSIDVDILDGVVRQDLPSLVRQLDELLSPS